jgi:hypothetical protein
MASAEEITALRLKTGEVIPEGGSAADTMFSDEQFTTWIDTSGSTAAAALQVWEAKLAAWAGLVDVTDGAAQRALSDLMDHGTKMIGYYEDLVAGPNRNRTRVGKIVRS